MTQPGLAWASSLASSPRLAEAAKREVVGDCGRKQIAGTWRGGAASGRRGAGREARGQGSSRWVPLAPPPAATPPRPAGADTLLIGPTHHSATATPGPHTATPAHCGLRWHARPAPVGGDAPTLFHTVASTAGGTPSAFTNHTTC